MDATSHTDDDESIESKFWQQIAEKVRATDSDVHGCYSVELTGEDETRTYPVADCLTDTVGDNDAMALVIPLDEVDDLAQVEDSVTGVGVGGWQLTATVAKRESRDDLFTAWLVEPEIVSPEQFEGPPTKEHIEFLSA